MWAWITSFFSREKLSNEAKAGMEKAGEDLANSIIDGFKRAIEGLAKIFVTLPARIKGWIKNIDLSDIITWPSWLGTGDAQAITPQNMPYNSPITRPAPQTSPSGYPANASGNTINNNQTVNSPVTINVNGAGNAEATGRAVAKEIKKSNAAALHGGTE